LIRLDERVSIIVTEDAKKSSRAEQAILEKLENELDSMIGQLAGTPMDYDPATEAASLEAVQNVDSRPA
jgi:hypothetical protein